MPSSAISRTPVERAWALRAHRASRRAIQHRHVLQAAQAIAAAKTIANNVVRPGAVVKIATGAKTARAGAVSRRDWFVGEAGTGGRRILNYVLA